MSRRYRTILSMWLLLTMAASHAEDAANWDEIQTSDILIVDYNTSIFSGHWCILTFLANRTETSEFLNLQAPRPGANSSSRSASSPFFHSANELPHRSSLFDELKETKFLQLMTLWRGREKLLVLGIDSNGMLGFNLDEVVASNR